MIGKLTDLQKQIIVGTVLGGSSLIRPPTGKNYYLAMRDADPLWLLYKIEELEGCFKSTRLIQDGKTYRCNSICAEAFTELHDHMYRDGKRSVSEEVLSPLRDIGLAVWFLDGGGKTGRDKKNIYLNTTKFGTAGTQVILDYFNSMSLACNLNQSNGRIRVVFSVEGTEALLRIIAPRFPPFLLNDGE